VYETFRDEAVGDEIRAKETLEVEQSLLKDLYVRYNVFDIPPDDPIYRITAAAHVLTDVANSTLTHTRINKTTWDDHEENPLLGRTFKTAEGEIGTLAITENTFGQCWSHRPLTGDNWRTFRHGLPSVRLESTPHRLLAGVMDATNNKYYVLQHAIGKMIYRSRSEIEAFFSNADFTQHLDPLGTRAMLSLWRLRTGLSDEDEVRLLFDYHALNSWDRQFVRLQEPRAAVRFSWDDAITSVEGEPGLSAAVLNQVRAALRLI
jgi:hypothetical protein